MASGEHPGRDVDDDLAEVRRGLFESAVSVGSAVGFGLALGAFIPGAGELVGSSIGAEVPRLAAALHEVRRGRAERMYDQAADQAKLSAQDLADRLVETTARAQLTVTVLDGASRSIADEKLRMFADILASGALSADDAQLEVDTLLARALVDVEVPHFRVLAELEAEPCDTAGLREELGPLADGMDALLAVLRSHGLIDRERRRPTPREIVEGRRREGGPDEWWITPFGETLLARARTVGLP